MNRPDVIVIGGGTSGMMAAIHAGMNGARVLLLEKNYKLGRKLILTGGGRCNVTNRSPREVFIDHIPGNGKFLYSVLEQFDSQDIIDFFQTRGVRLKEEDHGRMFPISNSARTIRDCLINEMRHYAIEVIAGEPVEEVLYNQETASVRGVQTSKATYTAKAVILASGGKAYPRTGSTGDGYRWAKDAGHSLTDFYATEVPLLSNDSFIQDKSLQGISLRDVNVKVLDKKGKTIVSHQMDMIFTHFGYSGPAILRCSGHVNLYLKESQEKIANLTIDLIPYISYEELKKLAEEQREKQVDNILRQWLPDKLNGLIQKQVGIQEKSAYKQVNHSIQEALWKRVKAFPLTVYGSQPLEKGFVTGGGVNLKEITPQTMASKLMKGLYFCGEIIDINGYTGGYNITAAFATGAVSGQHAAWFSLSS
ncbi:NAD(P)/FAD-dependent oxidoreductase [Facklamia sp. P12945]|uniref:NAD(P)/FAD-dependent oxidoreductase n=1 Tax=unclassified Facklamia TaxID=2622293 RepID=UPI003D170C73